MSWHYLLGQGEASWEENSLDGAPSVLLRLIPTAGASCSADSETGYCRGSQSGTTCARSTENHGEDELTSSVEDSRVRTLAQLEKRQGSQENAADCGENTPGSSERLNQGLRLSKTLPSCAVMDLCESSKILPSSGTMRSGWCFPRERLVLHTYENECGLLPTLSACSYGSNRGGAAGRVGKTRESLASMAKNNTWPTPNATDYKGPSTRSLGKERPRCDDDLPTRVGGQLNPTWVEWLMGWPLGWTDLEPLETVRFRQWLQLHGRF